MPYARRTGVKRPSYRRRRVGVKRRTRVRKAPIYRRPKMASSGLPPVKYVKLKYCDSFLMPNLASPFGSHTLSVNSIYAPDYTLRPLSGHQPYAYDTWATLYNKYEVLSSYCVVRFLAGQGTQNAICGIEVVTDPDTTTTLSTVRERPTSYTKVLTTQFPCKVARKWSFRKDSPNHAGWNNTALIANNPSDEDYYRVFCASIDGTANLTANSITAVVETVYTVKLWERALLAGS